MSKKHRPRREWTEPGDRRFKELEEELRSVLAQVIVKAEEQPSDEGKAEVAARAGVYLSEFLKRSSADVPVERKRELALKALERQLRRSASTELDHLLNEGLKGGTNETATVEPSQEPVPEGAQGGPLPRSVEEDPGAPPSAVPPRNRNETEPGGIQRLPEPHSERSAPGAPPREPDPQVGGEEVSGARRRELEEAINKLPEGELRERVERMLEQRKAALSEVGGKLLNNPDPQAQSGNRMPPVRNARVDVRCSKCGMDNYEFSKSCTACGGKLK